jgi:hypothetical protein
MQQFAIFTTIAALAAGSSAAVIGSRDAAEATFRIYSGTDCFTGNEGFAQVYNDGLEKCESFAGSTVYSVNVTQVNDGCTGQ